MNKFLAVIIGTSLLLLTSALFLGNKLDQNQIKSEAVNISDIGYDNFRENSENYKNDTIYFKGRIVRSFLGDNYSTMVVGTAKKGDRYISNNQIYGKLENSRFTNLTNQDYITGKKIKVWGEYKGRYGDVASMNPSGTVPGVIVQEIETIN